LISKAEKMLTELVLIRSAENDSMQPVTNYVTKVMKELGMHVRNYGSKDNPAMIGQFMENGVMLSGHLDTVPIGTTGWTKKQGEMIDGVLYGRGTGDMKGGCVAMLLAAEEMVKAKTPFSLCFTTDEETSMAGAAAASIDPAVKNAPAVMVTEATDFDIVIREKGLVQFEICTDGKSAHASMPHLGENAIVKMVDLLQKMKDLQIPPEDPVEHMTLTVDVIRGGTATNVIPAECVVEVDVRYPPEMNTSAVLDEVRKRIGDDGYEIKILHELDPVGTDPSIEAVTTLKEVIGPDTKVLAVPYATEMVMFKSANDKLMICGPGDPTSCHIPDEWIKVEDVAKAARIYADYCAKMAGL